MAAEDLRVVQEYGPEHAGELVGWVNVERRAHLGDEADFILASIAYARVAAEGARYSVIERVPGEHLYASGYIRGFDKSLQLSIATPDAAGQHIEAVPRQMPSVDRKLKHNSYPARRFADNLDYGSPENGDGEWLLGGSEILRSIKTQLSDAEAAFLYPVAYYTLAAMADAEDQLADPTMSSLTKIEYKLAEYRVEELMKLVTGNLALDEVIEDARSSELPDHVNAFVESRRNVTTVEYKLAELRAASALRGRLVLPYGEPAGVRTWPYMDAVAGTEHAAFGNERAMILAKNRSGMLRALGAETAEQQERLQNARHIARQLHALADKENEALIEW